jgi:hypothetical protein
MHVFQPFTSLSDPRLLSVIPVTALGLFTGSGALIGAPVHSTSASLQRCPHLWWAEKTQSCHDFVSCDILKPDLCLLDRIGLLPDNRGPVIGCIFAPLRSLALLVHR